jgi:HK97 gp10 family phage protein
MDTKQMKAYFQKVATNVPTLLSRDVNDIAKAIEEDAKSMVPVDTGALRDSITTTQGVLEATVGSDLPYAASVEYGTSKMAAQPFLTPAAQNTESKLNQILGKGDKYVNA